ncbi:hypothetical protein PTKIN_Ptkin02bG0096800 [Pterospermum kingtungense]
MAKRLEAMWNKFSLAEDEEEDLVLDKLWVEKSVGAIKNCMFIHKSYRIEGMKSVFQRIWRLQADLSIKDMRDYTFIFQFEEEAEKDRALIHSLPVRLMSERIEIAIEESLGAVDEVDCGDSSDAWGKSLRVSLVEC